MPHKPKASLAKVAYHLKQLRKLFARASDEHFLQMVWAVDALCSGRPQAAALTSTKRRQGPHGAAWGGERWRATHTPNARGTTTT
jgi:hypothetical protein